MEGEKMKLKLLVNGLIKYISGLLLVGFFLFLPAGGFDFAEAWVFLGLLFIPMLILGIVLFTKSPELLEKRLGAKEKEGTQRGVIALSAFIFIGGFILAGLDKRFGWTDMPTWVIIVFSVVFLISYALYAEVMRENAYLSRTIEVQEGQKVIDTGLYGIVRHPMYTVTVILFLSIPIILGSWWSFFCFLYYPVLIIVRIVNEEKVLEDGLAGYSDYKKRVKYRLIPFIW